MSFESFLLDHETAIRLGFFFGAFVIMALWEFVAPLRVPGTSKVIRWSNHLGLVAMNIVLVRVLFPLAAVALAVYAGERGIGLLNVISVPYLLAFVGSFLVLDLAVYLFHLLFHAVPALWRVHRVHHADLDIDVTTGVRFHPIQMVLAVIVKSIVILVLGPPALAVLTFEAASHAITLFNHGNVKIAPALDRVLRWLVVTPDMHRVHHSIQTAETDSNFGFVLPWWDRIFGTYRAEPAAGQVRMVVGIESFRTDRDQWLDRLVLNPALDETGSQLTIVTPDLQPRSANLASALDGGRSTTPKAE
jgi:sterol desaturase/sphingolipid hydroxylase (fatty acid hydroxylase superfamily)